MHGHHDGGNRIYGLHMIIHNGQFAECEVLENCQGLYGPRTRTCKLVLENKDFPLGLQHWAEGIFATGLENKQTLCMQSSIYIWNNQWTLCIYLAPCSSKSSLTFWQTNVDRFPRLYQLHLKHHCIPVTSAAMEHAFSAAGIIHFESKKTAPFLFLT